MNNILTRKWVIGAAALIIVLAVGTVAWAETAETTGDGTEVPAEGVVQSGFAGLGEHAGYGPGMGRMGAGSCYGTAGDLGPRFGAQAGDLTEEEIAGMEQRMEERRAAQEERRNALHDLVRSQMNEEDQMKLDELEQLAQDKRQEMDRLRGDLRETTGQIRELLSTYAPELIPAPEQN